MKEVYETPSITIWDFEKICMMDVSTGFGEVDNGGVDEFSAD